MEGSGALDGVEAPDPIAEGGAWVELLDESWGRPYYYHTGTFVTQWERPEGFEGVSGKVEVEVRRLRLVWRD